MVDKSQTTMKQVQYSDGSYSREVEEVTKTTKKNISHLMFSRIASHIASNAASWAADCITLEDHANKPMSQDALDRFTETIRGKLEFINEKQ